MTGLPPYLPPASGALGALALAASRRVDLVYVSDSNGQYNGWGWSSAFTVALGAKYGLYASPVYPQEITGTSISNAGAPTFSGYPGAGGATSGYPSGQASYGLPFAPPCYQASVAIGPNNGLTISPSPVDAYGNAFNGFNAASNLRLWLSYGTFATGGGTFKPCWRMEYSPYTILQNGSLINCQTGTDGQAMTYVDLAAGARGGIIGAHWQAGGGTVSTPATTQFWQRAEDKLALAGAAVTQLYAAGGMDLYDYWTTFNGYTQAQWTNFFKAVTYSQMQAGQEPIVVMLINSGDNDINDSARSSIGPIGGLTNNTAAGYLDNLRGVYNLLTTAWAAAGLPTSSLSFAGLYFLIMPSQVYGPSADNATLISMRAAAARFAAGKPNVSFVDLAALVPIAELLANGGYNSQPHLSNVAYQYIATKLVNTFVR